MDALGWLVLPQPYRLAIPALLVGSTLMGIVLLSGAIGIPKNPRHAPEASGERDAPDADAAEPAARG